VGTSEYNGTYPGSKAEGREADQLPPRSSVAKNQYLYLHSRSTRLITLSRIFLALLYALKLLEQIRIKFNDNESLKMHCTMSVIII
jgi:hypothetical protein